MTSFILPRVPFFASVHNSDEAADYICLLIYLNKRMNYGHKQQ